MGSVPQDTDVPVIVTKGDVYFAYAGPGRRDHWRLVEATADGVRIKKGETVHYVENPDRVGFLKDDSIVWVPGWFDDDGSGPA